MTPRGQFEDEAPWIIDPIARPVKIPFAADDRAIFRAITLRESWDG
jgi:hypothetical protein